MPAERTVPLGGRIAEALGLDTRGLHEFTMTVRPGEPPVLTATYFILPARANAVGELETIAKTYRLEPVEAEE